MEHERYTDINPGQSPSEIFDQDVANLAKLHRELGLAAKLEVITAQIRREHGEARDRLAQTVLKKIQSDLELTPEQIEGIVALLKDRFSAEENKNLCPALNWPRAEKALRATPKALETVLKAEKAGHEPAIYFSDETGFDIGTRSNETSKSTRNCVFDEEAEQWWVNNYPDEKFNGNAKSQATAMGWNLMKIGEGEHIAKNTPAYREQGWSWYETNNDIRKAGRALGGNRRGDDLFVLQGNAFIHGVRRGWRGSLRVNFVD